MDYFEERGYYDGVYYSDINSSEKKKKTSKEIDTQQEVVAPKC